MQYTIREVAQRTGLTASALRYYEREGLLCAVQRNGGGRRVYNQQDMDWLGIITCLKNTGMPITEIRRFVALCGQGDSTLAERYRIVLLHRQATQARIEALLKELAHINDKVAYYRAACELGSEKHLEGCQPPQGDGAGQAAENAHTQATRS